MDAKKHLDFIDNMSGTEERQKWVLKEAVYFYDRITSNFKEVENKFCTAEDPNDVLTFLSALIQLVFQEGCGAYKGSGPDTPLKTLGESIRATEKIREGYIKRLIELHEMNEGLAKMTRELGSMH